MANRTPRISEEQKDVIVALYEQGLSRLEVAARVGSVSGTITKILEERGVAIRPHFTRKIPPADVPVIAERYRSGEHIAALAATYGCTELVIRRVLDKHGMQRRDDRGRRREYTAEEVETIRRMAAEGESQSQIAAVLGSAQGTVSRLMRQQGIAPAWTGAAKRDRHYNWAGGRVKHPSGYWQVRLAPDDPLFGMANRSGYVMEHRLVVAREIGRPLRPEESVHHINGDRFDNRPENLQLHAGKHGSGQCYRCLDCGSTNVVAVEIAEPEP